MIANKIFWWLDSNYGNDCYWARTYIFLELITRYIAFIKCVQIPIFIVPKFSHNFRWLVDPDDTAGERHSKWKMKTRIYPIVKQIWLFPALSLLIWDLINTTWADTSHHLLLLKSSMTMLWPTPSIIFSLLYYPAGFFNKFYRLSNGLFAEKNQQRKRRLDEKDWVCVLTGVYVWKMCAL